MDRHFEENSLDPLLYAHIPCERSTTPTTTSPARSPPMIGIRKLLNKVFGPAITPARRRPSTRLSVEALEDRMVPTVVFNPQFGPISPPSGWAPLGLQSSSAYLIFD